MKGVRQTILSQYGNSPVLLGLIDAFNAAVDPSDSIDEFYDKIWNVLTAEGYGLDVWGRIVGVNRIIEIPSDEITLGFEEAGNDSAAPFNQATFFTGSIPIDTTSFALPDYTFRILILVKALSNISRAAVPVYNRMLMQLFPGRGNCYVSDTGDMEMRLVFEFLLKPYELAILRSSNAFAGPTGVGLHIMDLDVPYVFGFAEAGTPYSAGFNHGVFFSGFDD